MRTFSESEIEDVEAAIATMPHFDIEYQAFVKASAVKQIDDDDTRRKSTDRCRMCMTG